MRSRVDASDLGFVLGDVATDKVRSQGYTKPLVQSCGTCTWAVGNLQ